VKEKDIHELVKTTVNREGHKVVWSHTERPLLSGKLAGGVGLDVIRPATSWQASDILGKGGDAIGLTDRISANDTRRGQPGVSAIAQTKTRF
jgi:hypothetical protein